MLPRVLQHSRFLLCKGQARPYSQIRFDGSSDDVEEIIERSLDRRTYRKKDEDLDRKRVLTTRREALSLYREILRYSRLFVWKSESGQTWQDVLRNSARQEFEAARFETDPEIVNRLLVGGRDCLQQTVDKFMARRQQVIDDEANKSSVNPQWPQPQ